MSMPTVNNYMSVKKELVSPDDSVQSAIELMVDHDQGSVIVVDEENHVLGIFTDRDLTRHYLMKQSKFLYFKVCEVMSSPVATASDDTPIDEALKMMTSKKIRRLPVVDSECRMIGFLSWKELFAKFQQQYAAQTSP